MILTSLQTRGFRTCPTINSPQPTPPSSAPPTGPRDADAGADRAAFRERHAAGTEPGAGDELEKPGGGHWGLQSQRQMPDQHGRWKIRHSERDMRGSS